eukprot:4127689-Alexandrium_andersonii.AAC.1
MVLAVAGLGSTTVSRPAKMHSVGWRNARQCQAEVNGEYTPRCTRSQCTMQDGAGSGDGLPPSSAARRAESL